MIKKMLLTTIGMIGLCGLGFSATSIYLSEDAFEAQPSVEVQDTANEKDDVHPLHWVNLGCTESDHACHHHAHDDGYTESYIEYDHEGCEHHNHHTPYRCYAR